MRELKKKFKRDVVFEYEVAGRVLRVHDDATFDRAMALAERSDNRLFVVIQDAAWKVAQAEDEEPDEPDLEEEVANHFPSYRPWSLDQGIADIAEKNRRENARNPQCLLRACSRLGPLCSSRPFLPHPLPTTHL
jgi:hypothetical protein